MESREGPLPVELELLEPVAVAGPAASEGRTLDHAGDLQVLRWLTPDRRPRPAPDDGSVRRVLVWDVATSRAVLASYLAELAPADAEAVVVTGHNRLVLERAADAGGAWSGVVHLRRAVHAVPVRLVVDEWSALRTELRLERTDASRRGHRGLRRWYDGVHPLLDVLRFEISLRAPDLRGSRLSG
jgi:hypothetical protein